MINLLKINLCNKFNNQCNNNFFDWIEDALVLQCR